MNEANNIFLNQLRINDDQPLNFELTDCTKRHSPIRNVNKAVNKVKKINERVDTTKMLLIVCILFLITEFPQAILIFVSIFDSNFYNFVYKPLGDLMDVLVLINNSINFILYCTMSNEFRQVILNFFKKK
jgi:hypothetical protein